jgi:hypothetical protein
MHKKESSSGSDDLRWSVERRLHFVEQQLFWVGRINRQDLIKKYGISMSQASADINKYLALDPRGIRYDKSAKCYVADETFHPLLTTPDADRILAEFRLVDIGVLEAEATSLGAAPPLDATPIPERAVDPAVLRAVLLAIRRNERLAVRYQSMSRPEPIRRIIEPHALAHDGFRWHVRARDEESEAFRDFVLGRISMPAPAGPAGHTANADADWNDWVDLQIAPHPDLTVAQREAVRLDYGISGEYLSLRVRRAILFYALRRLGLDTPPEARRPHEQHIVLLNREAILNPAYAPLDD